MYWVGADLLSNFWKCVVYKTWLVSVVILIACSLLGLLLFL